MEEKTINALLIEDNPFDARILRDILDETEGTNFDLKHNENLSSGIENLKGEKFDIIFLDLNLPDSHGLDTLKKIIDQNSKIPIIVYTAEDDEKTALEAIKEGAQDYLVKGQINPVLLFRSIRYSIERKRASETLKETESRYKFLVDNVRDIIYVLDKYGNYKFLNKAQEELRKYKIDELIGTSFWSIVTPVSLKKAEKIIPRLMAGEDIGLTELDIYDKDGNIETIEFLVRPIYEDGEIVEYLGVTRIVTERKKEEEKLKKYKEDLELTVGERTAELNSINTKLEKELVEHKKAEEALRDSEEKYRTILENIEDGYYEADLNGNITFFNDSTLKIIGYSRDELVGMNNREFMDEDTAKEIYATFNEVYRTGKPTKALDWELIGKNNKKVIIEVSISLITDLSKKPIGFRGIARDITERKHFEEQILRSQRMQAIATLAAGIAHDFNNLLATIMGYASYLKEKSKKGDFFYEGLDAIENSSLRASHLTSQLLAYTRRGKLEIKPIDINRVIKGLYGLISKTFDKSIKIILETDDNLKTVEGDESQLSQIIMNIAINAQDAMPMGGVFEIQTYMKRIKNRIKKPYYDVEAGEYVCMRFRDSGIGMDEDTLKKVFEPYFTTKGGRGGTGLGMSVVFGIVKGHNGYIDIQSSHDDGTEITIFLPSSTKVEALPEKESLEVKGGSETILVIDDEIQILKMVEKIFKKSGYNVYTAQSGREGLKIFGEKGASIDLVILDIKMPDMSGKETLTKLLEDDPKVKVLLVSGFSEEDQHHDLLKMGAKDFIGKPFFADKILKKIRDILD